MIEQELLTWMEAWFSTCCNGKWEHGSGIKIETLDNPGWSVSIELAGTPYERVSMPDFVVERDDTDWVSCSIKDGVFRGFGGMENLKEILNLFKAVAGGYSDELLKK
ncbi:hypothetical protein GCM10007860_24370 [Chitiniphilus shinanonensis]|uniref:Rhodanese-related sulfurtransferase n=1 Tax=Chitiniphilus shinanonensis TaxID=553088 RepID=A0ABQ6BYH7_9NEIS|nr:immunity 53 family protein [Chitiniphilus shinanonensis]GLS05287.1 hypothetical protein GCM10007860_24370 [Chitiniphilus shinanonensis]